MDHAIKRCTRCNVDKALTEFGTQWNKARGKRFVFARCKICRTAVEVARRMEKRDVINAAKKIAYAADPVHHRRWALANPERQRASVRSSWLKIQYGMTVDDYEARLKAQGGRCAICRSTVPGGLGKNRFFCVDHDHQTNEVRGLLCHSCNKGIGHLGDDPDRVYAAAVYLRDRRAALLGAA